MFLDGRSERAVDFGLETARSPTSPVSTLVSGLRLAE